MQIYTRRQLPNALRPLSARELELGKRLRRNIQLQYFFGYVDLLNRDVHLSRERKTDVAYVKMGNIFDADGEREYFFSRPESEARMPMIEVYESSTGTVGDEEDSAPSTYPIWLSLADDQRRNR